jgi:hypothetical protein
MTETKLVEPKMESVVLLPALSLVTLDSIRRLLEEYLEQYFQIKVVVHSVTTEVGRGLSFIGSRELALFWEREFNNLSLLDGFIYLSLSPLDELLLQEQAIDYKLFNQALFVKELPELETLREEKIKEGWRFLQTCFTPVTTKLDSSFLRFFKHIVAEPVLGLRTGLVFKIAQPDKYPEVSLNRHYQDFIRKNSS